LNEGLYRDGQDALRHHNYKLAAELFQKAVDQGIVPALAELGRLYDKGRGVTKNSNKAAELYQKAANQGDPGGQAGLGRLYAEGKAMPQDTAKALDLC
jgi:TPR repeat protein